MSGTIVLMNSTRIIRGAVRSNLLIRESIHNSDLSRATRSVFSIRSLVLSFIALRIAMPVPLVAAPASSQLVDDALVIEPPNMVRLNKDLIKAIIILNDTQKLAPSLGDVEAGKSFAVQKDDEAARIHADQLRQEAEAHAKQQQQERLAILARAKAKALEASKLRAQASVPAPAVLLGGSPQEIVRLATIQAFGEEHWPAMSSIIMRESGFNPNSLNKRSGACGLFQALPCSKMGGMEINNQVRWGMGYVRARYGNPTNAWNFWLSHRWY